MKKGKLAALLALGMLLSTGTAYGAEDAPYNPGPMLDGIQISSRTAGRGGKISVAADAWDSDGIRSIWVRFIHDESGKVLSLPLLPRRGDPCIDGYWSGELELPEDILYLPMDSLLVRQVMVNLLENAIRHSGDTEHIRMRLYRQDDQAVAEVRDRGRGLSPEVLQAVRTGEAMPLTGDATRGMGIGLSVCQSIIKAHGGFFTAENDPSGGAVFRFGLPAA